MNVSEVLECSAIGRDPEGAPDNRANSPKIRVPLPEALDNERGGAQVEPLRLNDGGQCSGAIADMQFPWSLDWWKVGLDILPPIRSIRPGIPRNRFPGATCPPFSLPNASLSPRFYCYNHNKP